ncbi:MAG TPA: carbohydrate kinase family protein [Ensifer sp.]|nr:carbohydrate kinase family protein [Ensifer sp.]
MSGLVITGYASLDHVVVLSGGIVHGRTTTISDRPADAWPRLGGGPAFVAAAARRTYPGPIVPVSWVGSDALGETYIEQLSQRHVSSSGMVRLPGARSPVSMLIYNPAGDCACLYDPGIKGEIGLSEYQRQLVEAASWICVTIGPKTVTDEVLEIVRRDQRLAWIVKNDPAALSTDQAARLAKRADVIFCNGRERAFLAEVMSGQRARNPDQWLVETRGQRGALFEFDREQTFVAAEAISVRDPTGAGDSFAGGVLAALMNGETDPQILGRRGHQAAHALLSERKSEEEREQG